MGFSRELSWFQHLHWASSGPKKEAQRTDPQGDFESFDAMERGLCTEGFALELIRPSPANSSKRKMRVERSADRKRYVLFDDATLVPLLDGRIVTEESGVFVHIYSGIGDEKLPSRGPAFTMTADAQKTHWRLCHCRCEHCMYRLSHLLCGQLGGQTLAVMSHSKENVGPCVALCMDVAIPQVNEDNTSVVWCPLNRTGAYDSRIEMTTLRPKWDKKAGSLVMDFKGRIEAASAKNFQLCLDDRAVLVYGKLKSGDFRLEFEHPLSPIQAFAIALTTQFWT